MTDQDQRREAFERHVLAPTGIYENGAGWITRNSDGSYRHANIQERWTTWQAALNHKADVVPTTEESSGVVLPEPVGFVDEFGNFEKHMQIWMREEPGVTWQPVHIEQTVRALLAAAIKESLTTPAPHVASIDTSHERVDKTAQIVHRWLPAAHRVKR